MKSAFLAIATALLLPFCVSGQMIEDPTTWTYEVKKTGDQEYDLIFKVELKEGWHVFSQDPGDEFLIPPSFSFNESNLKKLGKVAEEGMLKTETIEGFDKPVRYFEGTARFIQKVKARAGSKIEGEHEYQVCNDRMCLPPKTKSFVFRLP